MDVKKIALILGFTCITGGTTLYAMTGPGLESYGGVWLVTHNKTRGEFLAARIEQERQRQEYDRANGRGSVRSYSGGNSRYSGRVK